MKLLKKFKFQLIFLSTIAVFGSIVFNYQAISVAKLDERLNYVETTKHTAKYPLCSKHNPESWHPATEKDQTGNILCIYGHEHGDQPPEWVLTSGNHPGFDHNSGFMANTSPLENDLKHNGMKGFSATIKGIQIYARIHLASNPLDRGTRYHSYDLFLRDPAGGISHFQGWLDSGNPQVDRIPYRDSTFGEKSKDPGRRPIVWASTRQACQIDQTWCIELWSLKTAPWGPDIIWGINDATTYYKEGEAYTADSTQWDKSGTLGTDRSLTVTLYRKEADLKKRGITNIPVGEIWATQFGEIVSGPSDPRCIGKTIQFGESYQNICLKNYIAPTLPQITGVGNTAQKEFESTGVEIPN